MNITIFGAGNGAHALAGDLAARNFDVTLWENPNFSQNIEHLKRSHNAINVIGEINGTFKLKSVTTDAAEAVKDAEIIFVIMPSFGQEAAFDYMAPHIKEGQLIFIMPGNFGSLSLYARLKKLGVADKVIIGESDTIPYATRLTADKTSDIFGIKSTMSASAMPASKTSVMIKKLKHVLPLKLQALPSVIAVALTNTNMIIHCPTMIMNAGRIETGARFRFYNDGMSESVCHVMEKMDNERIEVAKTFGYDLLTEFESAMSIYSLDHSKYKTLHDIFSSHPVYSKMGADSPTSIGHRYLTEDVPYLLSPLSELGKTAGIPMPTVNAIIDLAGIVNMTDFRENCRGLQKLGLTGLSMAGIANFVQ